MVPVQTRSRAVMSELPTVLHLADRDAFRANRAGHIGPRTAPGAIRVAARDFVADQRVSCLGADFYLIGHDLGPRRTPTTGARVLGSVVAEPDAREPRHPLRLSATPWKAAPVYPPCRSCAPVLKSDEMPSRAIAVAPLRNTKATLVRISQRRRRTKIGPIHVTYALAAGEVGHPVRQSAQELCVGAATVDRAAAGNSLTNGNPATAYGPVRLWRCRITFPAALSAQETKSKEPSRSPHRGRREWKVSRSTAFCPRKTASIPTPCRPSRQL